MPSALPIKCDDYVTVQKYLETRIDALENIINKTFEMNNIAISKAEENLVFKIASLNELRGVVEDQQKTFLQIAEFKGFQVSQIAEWKAHLEIQQKAFDNIKDQINTLLPTAVFNAYKDAHSIETSEIKKRITELEINNKIIATKASMPMVWVVGLGSVVGVILSLINLFAKFQ